MVASRTFVQKVPGSRQLGAKAEQEVEEAQEAQVTQEAQEAQEAQEEEEEEEEDEGRRKRNIIVVPKSKQKH